MQLANNTVPSEHPWPTIKYPNNAQHYFIINSQDHKILMKQPAKIKRERIGSSDWVCIHQFSSRRLPDAASTALVNQEEKDGYVISRVHAPARRRQAEDPPTVFPFIPDADAPSLLFAQNKNHEPERR